MRTALFVPISISLMATLYSGVGRSGALFDDRIAIPLPANHTHRGYTGDIVELKDGTLLLAYAAPPESPYRNGIAGRKSLDGGRTWGAEFQMQSNAGKIETIDANLLRLANGELLFGYLVTNNYTGSNHRLYDGHYYVRRSANDGRNWKEPLCITPYPGFHTINPDRIIQLSSGRIVAPTEWSMAVGGGEAGHMTSLAYYSDDGYTWLRSQNYVDVGSTTEEPSIVELKDHRLLMVFRNRSGYVGRAYSADQGDTWSKHDLLNLASPLAPQLIRRIPKTGDLLLIWCNNTHSPGLARHEKQERVKVAQLELLQGELRAPLTTAISRDEGKTWEHIRNVTQDPPGVYGDYGYPALTWIESDSVGLLNYHSVDGLHVARIGVDWFYGK